MTADPQSAFFETFGYLLVHGLLTAAEMSMLASEGERVIGIRKISEKGDWADHDHSDEIAECSEPVTDLMLDDRIYGTAARLLGEDMIWGGSEYYVTRHPSHGWHSDRPGTAETDFPRLKIMIYLDTLTPDTGALRLIPGSHRLPLHDDLNAHQKSLFGLPGTQIPCQLFETKPGDVIFFHHSLYHGAYGGRPGRRYVAFKFLSRPRNDQQLTSIQTFSKTVYDPHARFTGSTRPRVRRMVDPIHELRNRTLNLATR